MHDPLHVRHEHPEVVVEQVVLADRRLAGPEAELGPGDDAELAEAAAHGVEEVAVLLPRAVDDVARAGHHLELEGVVGLGAVTEARHPEAGHRQGASDAHPEVVGEHPRHQPLLQGGGDEIAPDHPGAAGGGGAVRVFRALGMDRDRRHLGGVDDDAPLARRLAALGVGLAARHHRDAVLTAEADDRGDVGGVPAARHGGGQVIHHPPKVGAGAGAVLLGEEQAVPQELLQLAQNVGRRAGGIYGHNRISWRRRWRRRQVGLESL